MEQQIKEFDSLTELLEDLEREGITGYRKKKIVYAYLGNLARQKERPIVASFELTPLCNFDCKMCFVHLSKDQMGNRPLLKLEQWKKIIDMSIDAGIIGADLTGGECLTYPYFKEVYLHLYRRGIRPAVLTNGSLLTDDIVAFFEEYSPELIQISLYGSDSAGYRKVTGCNSFDAVMAGIGRLKKAKLPFRLVITPSSYMQEEAFGLLDYVRELGVPYEIGGMSLPARPETERSLGDYVIDARRLAEIQKNEISHRLANPVRMPGKNFYCLRLNRPKYTNGAPCGAAHNNFHVNWKGEMTPCISFHSVTSSILDKGIEAAWKDIRLQMEAYKPPVECNGCDHRMECSTCPAEKCFGTIGSHLNVEVCKRLKAYRDAGLMEAVRKSDCLRKGDGIYEEEISDT